MGRIAGRFARVEPRRHARELVLGLLAGLPRKNCWTHAEHVGHATPDGLQHLLARAKWDAEAIRDDLRGFVVDHLGADEVVLVVDETGDLKKGTHTVGVQRQYTGTAGRIENSQVAVYLAYSTPRGHTAVDRELYVPWSWTDDPDRCRAAGIPETHTFATKPQLAVRMIERALDAGIPAGWVTGDEVYGDNTHLRTALEKRGQNYVLAVSCRHHIATPAGNPYQGLQCGRGGRVAAVVGEFAGAAVAADEEMPVAGTVVGDGGQGPVVVAVAFGSGPGGQLLPGPLRDPLDQGVSADLAGRRWTVEETFQSSKGLAGLDEHQVRRWTSWHRWVTLAMLAHAFLAAVTALEHDQHKPSDGLIPLTRNEIQHLFTTFVTRPLHTAIHRLRWSQWRRRHQARAQAAHYQRQDTQPA
ncbi:IS701 family transposase [Streptomyces sp. NPDC001832]|uniref:IS701 family transposase n=1 Tax=Streptomyces sp. NPDC001832 TaxID=3154527 RepID=UPI0033285A3F